MNDMSEEGKREMPKYICHKQVWALKIADIRVDGPSKPNQESDGNAATIFPSEEGFGSFRVDSAYLEKHKPEAGGYYVVYKGGYKSFSPADAFEDGYSPA